MRPRGLLPSLIGIAGFGALAAVALAGYSAVELERFRRVEIGRATLLVAAPQVLRPGVHVRRMDLPGVLARLQYRETRAAPAQPGEFRRLPTGWEISLRRVDGGVPQAAQPVRVDVQGDRIARLSRNGKPIGSAALEPEVLTSTGNVPGEEMRPVRLSEVPPALKNAVLAAEDHRFFEHRGLDTRGMARALWTNLRAARVVQGGSTITQQLVKSRLLGRERTVARKLREAWLATLIEWRYDKDEILEAYLNEVYMGHRHGLGIRGVGAAARLYFGREPHQLTLGEAALLAGMIRAPNHISPLVDTRRARERRDAVLGQMRALGMIAPAEHDRALAEPVRPRPTAATGQLAPYFADHARREAEERTEGALGSRALRVVTTLDPVLQRFAETAVARGLDRLEARRRVARGEDPADRLQAALVALDPRTGGIRAMVGGRDHRASQFNRAALASRQPGSAFKPFVYLAALRRTGGRPPVFTAASMVEDSPVTLAAREGQPWSPRNFDDHYEGRITVRRALEGSLNAATVRIAQRVGMPAVAATARAVGLANPEPVPALALGATEVSPLDLARGYLPLANGGKRLEASAVSVIHGPDGQVLWAQEDTGHPVLSPAEAYLITSLLQGVVRSGTAAGLVDLSTAVAGKTGTTNDGRDAWFVGYSTNLVALVWVGSDSGRARGLSGARTALPIWVDFMRQALDTYPAAPFAVPDGISVAEIDPTNGQRATEACPLKVREVFLTGTEPAVCEEHQGAVEHLRRRFWQPLLDWFRRGDPSR